MASPDDAIRTLRTKIEDGEHGHAEDRDLLLDFSDRLFEAQPQLGPDRHLKYLRHASKLSEDTGPLRPIVDEPDSEGQARDLVRHINTVHDNGHTRRDFRLTLRKLGKLCTPGDDHPPSVAWIPGSMPSGYDPLPDREEILDWEEVEQMADGARNPRDAALVVVAMELGARSSELHNLRVGDLEDSQKGVRVHIDGAKDTGKRTVPLIRSVDRLNVWLSVHPADDDPTAPLWTALDSDKKLSYRSFNNALKRTAKRASIPEDRTVTPTGFRKSNACWLAREGMTAALIEDRQGRQRGSDSVRHYIARFADDESEDAYLDFLGFGDDGAPTCPRCGDNVGATADRCRNCGMTLDPEAEPAAGSTEAPIDEDMQEYLTEFVEIRVAELLDEIVADQGDDLAAPERRAFAQILDGLPRRSHHRPELDDG